MDRTQLNLNYPTNIVKMIKEMAKQKRMKINMYIESLVTKDINKHLLSAKINPEDRPNAQTSPTDSLNPKENKGVKQNATKI